MPFTCVFQLNHGALGPTDDLRFVRFLDENFGTLHASAVDIAIALFNGAAACISTNCPCFPSTKGKLVSGEQITAGTIIGYFAANGEDIPYSKPYATIRLMAG